MQCLVSEESARDKNGTNTVNNHDRSPTLLPRICVNNFQRQNTVDVAHNHVKIRKFVKICEICWKFAKKNCFQLILVR